MIKLDYTQARQVARAFNARRFGFDISAERLTNKPIPYLREVPAKDRGNYIGIRDKSNYVFYVSVGDLAAIAGLGGYLEPSPPGKVTKDFPITCE